MKFLKPIFFIFIFLIPFEVYKWNLGKNIISLRPYQVVAFVLLLAIAYFFSKKQISANDLLGPFKSPISKLLAVYFIISLISLFNAPNLKNGIQETAVFLSFLVIYWLVIFFIRTKEDIKNTLYVILASGLFTAVYGIIQVIVYKFGLELIEIMPGRPNSILPEPDWLGFFMVFVLAVLISSRYFETGTLKFSLIKFFKNKYTGYGLDIIFYAVVILALARASWIALIVVIGFYLYLLFLDKSNSLKLVFKHGLRVLVIFLVGLGLIYAFSLTPFSLKNRFLSIVTQEEIHAVAINPDTGEEISIRKEQIEELKKRGIEIKTKNVEDVNVLRRKESFADDLDAILTHPFLGIGFGGVELIFGEGANANNIFMEVWVATGTIGLIIFALIFYCIFREWLFLYIKKRSRENLAYLFFVILGFIAIIIPNMFNSGLFLGFLWVYLGVTVSIFSKNF